MRCGTRLAQRMLAMSAEYVQLGGSAAGRAARRPALCGVPRKARRLGSWLVVVVALVLALPRPGFAASLRPVSITPAAITLDAHGRGSVTITNRSCKPVVLTSLVLGSDGSPVVKAHVSEPPGGTVGPRASARMTVVASGLRVGSLIVVARTRGTLRVTILTVALAAHVVAHVAASPAVESWTIRDVLAGSTSGLDLPLNGTCGQLALRLPEVVGYVQADGVAVPVGARCPSLATNSVHLSPGPVPWAGRTYTGKIVLGPAGSAGVSLTVVSTTAWWIVALLIVAGICVAVAIAQWQGWRRGARVLLRRTYLIEQLVSSRNPNNADASFAAGAAAANLPENVRGWTITDAVRGSLAAVRATLRAQPSASDPGTVADIKSQLDGLEQTTRSWPNVANLLSELRHRVERLAVLTTYQAQIQQQTLSRPAGKLELQDIDNIKQAAGEALQLAADWPADAIEANRVLAQELPANSEALARLDAVRTRFGAAQSMDDARDALADFWEAAEAVHEAVAAQQPHLAEVALPAAGARAQAGIFVPVPVNDPAMTAKRMARQIFMFDSVVVAILLVVAVVAGVQALYVGKTFGGAGDVVTALVWGLGSGAIASALSGAVMGAQTSFANLVDPES